MPFKRLAWMLVTASIAFGPARGQEFADSAPQATKQSPATISLDHVRSPPSGKLPEWPRQQRSPSSVGPCNGVPARVADASPEELALVCQAVADALHLFARCHLTLQRPLDIELSKTVRNPFGGAIFGRFDERQEVIFVTRFPEAAALAEGTPYGEFPRPVFYMSLVVHEVAHAVMYQNQKRLPTSRAAAEYPAYAIQLATLPPAVRGKFLQAINEKLGKDNLLFNDIVLSFDPYFFAARAYEHFSDSSGGCGRLAALLKGEVEFVATLF